MRGRVFAGVDDFGGGCQLARMNPSDPETKVDAAEEVAEDAAEETVAASETETDAPEAEVEEPESDDPLAALERDVLKWRELAMRTAADLENYRKRASREREESMRYANQSLLEELLPILDNFEMGMQAAGQEQGSMIYIGMDMVRKQLNEFLANNGVTEVKAEGEAFDPNLHDAVSQEESEGEEGRVLRVTRRGFMLRDRLLRPAAVVVSKAPEAAKADGEQTEEG